MDTKGLLFQRNDEIREIQNRLLKRQLSLLAEASPHYKNLFKKSGFDLTRVRTVEDLANCPVTSKKDYINDPESFRLVHRDSNIFDTVWQTMYTAGTTTGKPTPFYYTTYDYYASLEQARKASEIIGLTPRDLVINLCPLTSVPHAAFHRTLDICTVTGTPIVSVLTGTRFPEFPVHNSADYAVAIIEGYRATCLFGMPSFIRRLLVQAVNEGRDYSSLRLICIFGEPCHKGMRDNMHELLTKLGAENIFITNCLGSTESSGTLGIECREFGGMHCPAPDLYYIEIVNPDTYSPLPEGEVGLLCLTHLNRRGTALLRFIMGDMISITFETCPNCGRNGLRLIGEPFRTSEIVKLKGTLINPDTLKAVLTSIPGIDEYRVIFTKENLNDPFSLDKLKIQISLREGLNSSEVLTREVMRKVRNAVEVTPDIEIVESTAIYDPRKSLKAIRIVDERPRRGE
jgi:phenylacetate-coenzyme A ligase PaaK-like adenylate-forming protein